MARIGVDLDHCCYDFGASMRHFLVTYRGYRAEDCPPLDSWEFYLKWSKNGVFMTLETFMEEFTLGVNAGVIFAWGGAYEGTYAALKRLVDAGHTLHVATDRTVGNPGVAEAATGLWVRKYLPKLSSLTFSADKTVIDVGYFIEDKLENYDALEARGVAMPYLFDRPWNQVELGVCDDRRRVRSMDEFVDAVEEMERYAAA